MYRTKRLVHVPRTTTGTCTGRGITCTGATEQRGTCTSGSSNDLTQLTLGLDHDDGPESGKGFEVEMIAELPNVFLGDEFRKFPGILDGFSIGSDGLARPTLGLGRDSGLVAHHVEVEFCLLVLGASQQASHLIRRAEQPEIVLLRGAVAIAHDVRSWEVPL